MENGNGSKKFFIAIITGLVLMVVNVVFTLAFRNDKATAVMQEKLNSMDMRLIRIENIIDMDSDKKLDKADYTKAHEQLELRVVRVEDNIYQLEFKAKNR